MVLYIAKRSLHDVGSVTHRQALYDIYGEDNVFIIDLISSMESGRKNYIGYEKPSDILERIKRALQGNVSVISNKMISDICDIIKREKINLVFSEESDQGNLVKAIKKASPNTYIISFYHDIMADLLRQWRYKMPGKKIYFRLVECNLSIRQEKINQKYCDENWVFHATDAEKFKNYYGQNPDVLIPLASPAMVIPDNVKCAVTEANEKKTILFVCSKYFVNRLGFKWFYEKVLPQLSGDFQIDVVGMGSDGLADFCKDDRVRLLGTVDDLSEYYLNADIVIAPIFDGGGMKVKTMEAVSYAKCLIGTTESLHGFWEKMPQSVRGNTVHKCDTAEEWVRALDFLINKRLNKFNEDLYAVYEEFFSYGAMLEQFREHLPNK